MSNTDQQNRDGVVIWDLVARILHWTQSLAVTAALLTGLLFYFRGALDIASRDAKYALIAFHAAIGYVVVVALILRIIWGFIGGRNARWEHVLPRPAHFTAFWTDIKRVVLRKPNRTLGPVFLNRITISMTFGLMLLMAVTGVFQAAVNFYDWPFGSFVRNYVAEDGIDPSTVTSRDPAGKDPTRSGRIGKAKWLSSRTHYYAAYVFLFMIVIHIAGAVMMDTRRRGSVISPMFIGKRFGVRGDDPGRDPSA